MTHVPFTALALAATVLASSAVLAETGLDTLEPLSVRVYDFGGVDSARLANALVDARAIFDDAGIASAWHDCTRRATPLSGVCREPRRTRDLIVRILRRDEARGGLPRALGVSVVESGRGVLATVFLDLVEPVAGRTGAGLHTLLGRAIAHEVGHLVLGTNAHSATGLMREIWTDLELGRNDRRDWRFEPGERALLREARLRLVARQAPAAPATFDANVTETNAAR